MKYLKRYASRQQLTMLFLLCVSVILIVGVHVSAQSGGNSAQQSSLPYWAQSYSYNGGYPARTQINNINGSTQANYGCFSWCYQNSDAYCNASAPLGAMSVSNLASTYGKSGIVYSNGSSSNTPENYVVANGDTVRLDWACQPSQTIVLVDGGSRNCPYAGRIDYNLANNVVVSGPQGAIYSGANVTGSTQFQVNGNPGEVKTYTLQCKRGSADTWTTTVPVVISNASLNLTANPQTVRRGQSSRLSWNVTGVNLSSCTLSGPSGVVWSTSPNTTTYSTPGTYSFTVPAAYSSIVATVRGAGGGGGGSGGHFYWSVSPGEPGGAGGVTNFNSSLIANGGGGGGGGCSSPPYHGACGYGSAGTASGGSNNVTGGGNAGGPPGTSSFCYNGGQGQPGGYTRLIYTAGQLSPGAKSIVIGAGGPGGAGASGSCGDGGAGQPGSVTIDLYPIPNQSYDTGPLATTSTYTLSCMSDDGIQVSNSKTVVVQSSPDPAISITGNGVEGTLTVAAGTPVTIEGTYAAGEGDTLVNTALNDSNSAALPGVAWTPPTAKTYVFTPAASGTYVFYPAVQTADHPAWNNYGKSLTVVVESCGSHELGTPPNCVCEPGYVMQGGSCQVNPCPGTHEVPPACTCASGYVRSGGTCVLPATVDIKVNGTDTARVRPNTQAQLTWTSSNVAPGSCTVKNAAGATLSSASTSSGLNVTITAQDRYTLRCTDGGGASVSDSAGVSLIPAFQEI